MRELQATFHSELADRNLGDRILGVVGQRGRLDRAAESRVESAERAIVRLRHRLHQLHANAEVHSQVLIEVPVILHEERMRDLPPVALGGDFELTRVAARRADGTGLHRRQTEKELRPFLRRIVERRRVVEPRVGPVEEISAGTVGWNGDVPALVSQLVSGTERVLSPQPVGGGDERDVGEGTIKSRAPIRSHRADRGDGGICVGGAETPECDEGQVVIVLHQLCGGRGKAQGCRVECIGDVAPFAESRPGAADVEHERISNHRCVAEGCSGVASVVEAAGDEEIFDCALAGGIRCAERPVVAIFAAFVPVTAQEKFVRLIEIVIDTCDEAVVVVRTQLIRKVIA